MIRAVQVPSQRVAGESHFSTTSTPVAQWLEQARAGSRSALGHLLCAHQGCLLRVAQDAISVNLQSKLDAADLVQDSLLDGFRNFGQFQGETPQQFRAWLRRILLNNAADLGRRYQHTGKRRSSLETSLDSAAGALPVDVRALPPEQAAILELQAILERTLAELPVHQRNVILLRQREQLSFAVIGEQTGRSAEAARKLWTRAVARLRTEVQDRLETRGSVA